MATPPTTTKRCSYAFEKLIFLKEQFQKDTYITPRSLKHLVEKTHLSEKQIKVWFCNERQKIKKKREQELNITFPKRNRNICVLCYPQECTHIKSNVQPQTIQQPLFIVPIPIKS